MNDWVEAEEAINQEKEPVAILASKASRIIAFILDLTLVGAFTFMFLSTFVIPRNYPGTLTELHEIYLQEGQSQRDLIAKMSPQLKDMIEVGQIIIALSFWIYFAASEIALNGASIGKRVFSIRVANELTLEPPSSLNSILRSGLKTFSLLTWPVFLVNSCLIFFTKKGQAGHDLLSRTVIIQDKLEIKKEDSE